MPHPQTEIGTGSMVAISFDTLLNAHIEKLILHASQYYNKRLPMPELSLALAGQKAGELCIQKITWHRRLYKLRLNQPLFEQHQEYFFQQVIPHEIAHLVVDRLHLRRTKPHGPEWQMVMRECFGCEPHAYHTLPTTKARIHQREYLYHCSCQQHYLTARRHASAQKGGRYICRACRQTLTMVAAQLTDECL